ncbi:MAG: 4Fe-4S binding protein, partial [Chloroflexota bacterium]
GELIVEPNPLLPKSLIAAVALALAGLLWSAVGPGDTAATRPTFDLARLPFVTKALGSRWFPWTLTVAILPFFVLAIVVGLAGTPVGNRNFAVVFVWIVWWALLMLVLVPLGGRVWCSACPLPAPGEWLQRRALVNVSNGGRLRTAGWRWPGRLRNMWLQNAGFLAVAVFSVPILTSPVLTGWVLLALIVGATGCSLLFERRVFCRYLCPVGGFIGLYAQVAPLSIRVKDRAVCQAHKAKACYTGSDAGYGCPWLIYPGALQRNAHCGLCAECVKTCPLRNVSLRLQAPGADLAVGGVARMDEAYKALIMLGSALAYAVVLTGPDSGLKEAALAVGTLPWVAYAATFLLVNVVALPGLLLAAVSAGRRLGHGPGEVRVLFAGWAKALIPLGLAAWAAFSLGLALGNGSYAWAVLSDPFGWGWNLFGTANMAWTPYATGYIPLLQALLLLLGLFWAVRVAGRQGYRLGGSRLAAAPVAVFCVAVTALLLTVYLG